MDPTRARFPFPKGGYESFYLTAHHPSAPVAAWIRCTVTQAPGGDPIGQRWVTLFEPTGPSAIRTEAPAATEGAWIRIGDASFADGIASGSSGEARWELRFSPVEEPLRYLPSERMYRGSFPKTKPISLAPHARIDGSISIADRTIDVDGWRGMIGHNWGSEHADRWVWLHAIIDERSWIDVVAARVKLGPVTSPWIANGAVGLDGVRHRLGGIARRGVSVDATPTGATLRLPGEGVRVEAHVSAPTERFVEWDYAHPSGGSSNVRNCSIADLELSVRLGSGAPRTLHVAHAAAYELGVA